MEFAPKLCNLISHDMLYGVLKYVSMVIAEIVMQWQGVEKYFFGGRVRWRKFFLVEKGNSKFLASGWRLPSILVVRKTLQNFKTLYLMIHSTDLFLT